MNNPTRPPLYAYQEAYKTKKRVKRVNRFTDSEYNRLVELISNVEQKANFKAHFRVYTSQKNMNELYHLLYLFISPKDMNEYYELGFIRVNYTANKAGREAAARDFEYISNIKKNGKIVYYDPNNPRHVKTQSGEWLYTDKSTNYDSTKYVANGKGGKNGEPEYLIMSFDKAQDVDALLEQNENEKKAAETNNYLLIGVIAVAMIIMIWTVKKNK